ncbi:type II secretion system protein GspH [Buttiauxella warmboldiae]|uniref:Type II secretion system protein H n=1 Tax=Buttiauxella warmboldiae TaxID=82993 RepID=A0A3N5EEA6_9ENTR|nr:type II secretion system minor pseudopilin GspH [Buttiauxella warmboldiae]RPH30136.1 type II secretion system protein GspH [Buttiauxella warmboldiae]
MTRVNGNRGFTLIEMMLVVTIVAAASSLVVMALPNSSPQKQAREMLARLADAVPMQRREAMSQGALLGLLITAHGYQFMVQDAHGWRGLSSTGALAAADSTLQLTQLDLPLDESPADEREGKPQILFFPGGETTPFELTAVVQKQAVARLIVSETGEARLENAAEFTP